MPLLLVHLFLIYLFALFILCAPLSILRVERNHYLIAPLALNEPYLYFPNQVQALHTAFPVDSLISQVINTFPYHDPQKSKFFVSYLLLPLSYRRSPPTSQDFVHNSIFSTRYNFYQVLLAPIVHTFLSFALRFQK